MTGAEIAAKYWAAGCHIPVALYQAWSKSKLRRKVRRIVSPRQSALEDHFQRAADWLGNRVLRICEEWKESLIDTSISPADAEVRYRARLREINTISEAMRQQFPFVVWPPQVDPLELQDELHAAVNNRPNVTEITRRRGA